MEISTQVSDSFIEELINTKVDIKFLDKKYYGTPYYEYYADEVRIRKKESGKETDSDPYIPFEITINDTFYDNHDTLFFQDQKYQLHLTNLKKAVQNEIDSNIKLRLGKWKILDYFMVLKMNLSEVSNGYYDSLLESHDGSTIYVNNNTTITSNKTDPFLIPVTGKWVRYALSKFWDQQMDCLIRILNYINLRKEIIEESDDYAKAISEIPDFTGALVWKASDTDLLELITALIESGSIQNQTKNLTRKEASEVFSQLFNIEIKDAESKLTRATSRKKDVSQYLSLLKNTFEDYAKDKEERLDSLRR